jgi:GNAT superfamily N-acetyltransferase
VRVVELTTETWPALERLFGTNRTVGGCWCVWFIRTPTEVRAGWGEDNRDHLRSHLGAPLGLLALDDDQPVGWVAVAPRATYARLRKSKQWASPGAGPDTWSVTCFFVRPKARRRGLASTLLAAAVDFAADRGATEIEAFPVDTEGEKRGSGDLFHGTLAMFQDAGFDLVDRRGPRRALVRKEVRR